MYNDLYCNIFANTYYNNLCCVKYSINYITFGDKNMVRIIQQHLTIPILTPAIIQALHNLCNNIANRVINSISVKVTRFDFPHAILRATTS